MNVSSHQTRHRGCEYLKSALHPNSWNLVVKNIIKLIEQTNVQFDSIAFRGASGLLVAPAICGTLGKGMVMVRTDSMNHSHFTVEGNFDVKDYIIVDDLICSGRTVQTIINAISTKANKAQCRGVYLYHGHLQNSSIECHERGVAVTIPVNGFVLEDTKIHNLFNLRMNNTETPVAGTATPNPTLFKRMMAFVCAGFLLMAGNLFCSGAPAFTERNIERAAIGEAADQGFKGMEAICCAIRNRGTLQGVYGFNSTLPDHSPSWVWKMAARAYQASAHEDLTRGCQFWDSTDFKRPAWSYGMQVRLHYKKHVFYYDQHYHKPSSTIR